MKLHNRRRVIAIRLWFIFLSTFIGAFLVLNMRFVEKNFQYLVAPGTIRTRDNPEDAIRLLPLVQNVAPEALGNTARLVIDKIGVNAPIVFGVPDIDLDNIYERLEDGVVHYSASAKPGNPGTGIILGHSSAFPWYRGDYGAVFALLSKMDNGDRFYVQYDNGPAFLYEVMGSVIFNPFKAEERLRAIEDVSGNNLILLSCYPVGTNYLRIAVQAAQVAK
jgi:LPXTG-site transpeptidase (sortase) family protein